MWTFRFNFYLDIIECESLPNVLFVGFGLLDVSGHVLTDPDTPILLVISRDVA